MKIYLLAFVVKHSCVCLFLSAYYHMYLMYIAGSLMFEHTLLYFVNLCICAALHSVSLRHYDGDPAKVGHFVSFACKAKGSINIGFTWYKDGHKIRFGQSTRDIWETRIPSSDKETHLSILSIEKTLPIDDGKY